MSTTDQAAELVKLPAVLDLAAADQLQSTLLRGLEAARPLRLDASDVETITLPCMQVIMAAAKSDERLAVVNPSTELVQAFADLALACPRAPDADSVSVDFVGGSEGEPAVEAVVEEASPALEETSALPCLEEAAVDTAPTAVIASEDVATCEEPPPLVPDAPEEALGVEIERGSECDAGEARDDAGPDDLQAGSDDIKDEFDDQDHASEVDVPKRILTIDDSKTMRDMLRVTLTDAGFDVLQGVDGQNGLDVLGKQRVDAVITDINMPIMDGYEVIRQLRRSPIHKSTPILVLTTESDSEKKKLARDAGATGWMVKPFDPERLIATVRKVAP